MDREFGLEEAEPHLRNKGSIGSSKHAIVILSGAKDLWLISWFSTNGKQRCFASLNMTGREAVG